MKNKKHLKTNQHKFKIASEHHQVDHSMTIKKQSSSHTKISTHIASHHINLSNQIIDKKHRSKIDLRSRSKQNSKDCKSKLPTSKSVKKFMINQQQNPINDEDYQPQVSYREYCVIDQSFVPVKSKVDQKYLEDLMINTASTSYDYTYFKNSNFLKCERKKGNQKSIAISQASSLEEICIKVDRSTSKPSFSSEMKDFQIGVAPSIEEIGIQYSERVCQSPPPQFKRNNQSTQIIDESLSDLLLKLQFRHLPDQKSFSKLSKIQKQHYRQLLESFIQKLASSPRVNIISNLQNSQAIGQSAQLQEQTSDMISQIRSSINPLPANMLLFEKTIQQIVKRQSKQMNQFEGLISSINVSNQNQLQKDQTVNTSMLAVINYLCNFFCFIELHYSQQMINMIRRIYGLTFREKYKRISKNVPLKVEKKLNYVIDISIFEQFTNEITEGQPNLYEIIHSKAIFCAFNELLDEYRPFYTNNGEAFPWSVKMFTAISQYSIDEDSIEVIFQQTRERMIEILSHLCGTIIDIDEKSLPPENPLELKRGERENKLILGWLSNTLGQNDQIQLSATKIMHDVSERIYNDLISEFSAQSRII